MTVNPVATVRYQYDNHLGSASLELDAYANIISYKEYHPFGTTSYRSGRTETETSQKRYKYVIGILKRVGIDINDARNGIPLDEFTHLKTGLHTEDAIKAVTKRLRPLEKYGTDAVAEELRNIGLDIKHGKFKF